MYFFIISPLHLQGPAGSLLGGGEVLGASRASEKYISDSPGRVRCEFMVLFLA